MQKVVGIINTGAGNIRSVISAFTKLDCKTILLEEPIQSIDILVIPGQGRFGKVMQQLRSKKLDEFIRQWYFENKPIIAICVGMQIFFQRSAEDPNVMGLQLFDEKVERLDTPKQPIIGWLELQSESDLLSKKAVYFVNGFGVKKSDSATSKAVYGEEFVASISSKGLRGFQFHPEKSGEQGLEVLKKCL